MCDAGKVISVSVSSFKSMFTIPALGEDKFKYPLPREGKTSQKTHPRANNNNQIPTPCPASPPAGFKLIGALVRELQLGDREFYFRYLPSKSI